MCQNNYVRAFFWGLSYYVWLHQLCTNRTQPCKSAFHTLSSLLADIPISPLLLHAQLEVRQSSGPSSH